jgi:hypothetical protein
MLLSKNDCKNAAWLSGLLFRLVINLWGKPHGAGRRVQVSAPIPSIVFLKTKLKKRKKYMK